MNSQSERQAHWEDTYRRKRTDEMSWFRPHLDQSLSLIEACKLAPDARIVDVGGGASTLAADLLARRFTNVAVLDLSRTALDQAASQLGERASLIEWIQGDVTHRHFDETSVDLWHDRAVLHFLTDDAARDAYLAELRRAVRPGGYVVLATFALDGPEKCSGLPVRRYSPDELAALLGPTFELRAKAHEDHVTPGGTHQQFAYVLSQRTRAPLAQRDATDASISSGSGRV